MEDEGNHGNDETRSFILSSLAQSQKSRVSCILCEESMFVFDRYPLVDGTFFLSLKQHSKGCTEVSYFNYFYFFPLYILKNKKNVIPSTKRCLLVNIKQ